MRFSIQENPTETDRICAILETAPDLPATNSSEELADWVWNFVQGVKESVIYHGDHYHNPWSADDVKRCLMQTLKGRRMPTKERKYLVQEYNRALGGGKFPKDWPEQIQFTVEAYAANYGQLPVLDREVFRNRSGYSPCFPTLLAALYMAGINNDEFIFAFPTYGRLFNCNRKLVRDLIKKVEKLGIVHTVRAGRFVKPNPDGKHTGSKCTWYTLDDADSLLNLFWFTTTNDKKRFIEHFGSLRNPIKSHDWSPFVITPEWLYYNRLL